MPLPHALQVGPSRTQPPGAGRGAFYPSGFQLPSPPNQPRSAGRFRAERSAAKVKQCEWRRLSTGGKRLSESGRPMLAPEEGCDFGRGGRVQPARTRAARPRLAPPPRDAAVPTPTALPSLLGLARRVRSAAHRRRQVQRGALRGAEEQPARDAGVLGGRRRPAPRGPEPRILSSPPPPPLSRAAQSTALALRRARERLAVPPRSPQAPSPSGPRLAPVRGPRGFPAG